MKAIKEWVLANNDIDNIKDIADKGCVTGICSDLIYYNDTVAFHDEHEDEIWNMLYEDAESQGITTMELIGQFNGQKDVGSMDQLKNMLCWYAVERVCAEIVNEREAA